MFLGKHGHLTYCTNIHPGETWDEVFTSLKTYVLPLKEQLSPSKPFGIGLRLSNKASCELIKEIPLLKFKEWLKSNDLYVFTLNGFPYGGFHGQAVKDHVHAPDWTTRDRLAYTLRLSKILAEILPVGMDGGISTSPVSYKPWLEKEGESRENVMNVACQHFFHLIGELVKLKEKTGKTIHIDIEPEPDGLIENSDELVEFFKFYLLPDGKNYLVKNFGMSSSDARSAIKTHIQACYDVCHHAVAFEDHKEVLFKYEQEGIKIGKFQLSAALRVDLSDYSQREEVVKKLRLFEESTYLHQVVEKRKDKQFNQYPDLGPALNNIMDRAIEEWRIHFHVPLFVDDYQLLQSTQQDIREILTYHEANSLTNHLEIETYTWDVLPSDLKADLSTSIFREIKWVLNQLNGKVENP